MGKPMAEKVWILAQHVASNGPLADPRRLGSVPRHLRGCERMIPTLMHGERITFGDQVSEKGKNRSRRSWIPNVQYRPLYSRALQMNVWVRVSIQALRAVEAAGGLDEYFASTPRTLVDSCKVAKTVRERILESFGVPRPELRGPLPSGVAGMPAIRNSGLRTVERPAGVVGASSGAIAAERQEMIEILGKTYGEEYAGQLVRAVTEMDLEIPEMKLEI